MPELNPHDDVVPIRRALLSVSDKRGLLELAPALAERGVHLLASGGTRTALADAGLDVTEVAAYTGQPEILGGRVKTLHPRLHGGILARRDVPDDLAALEAQGIEPIDLVVVNLYPFEATVARARRHLRGGGREHRHRRPLPDPGRGQEPRPCRRPHRPDQYAAFLAEIPGPRRHVARDPPNRWPAAAFAQPARYDRAIADYLARVDRAEHDGPAAEFPAGSTSRYPLRQSLRYGENPHQRAAFYVEPGDRGPEPGDRRVLHGKELSYNNLLDLDSALRLIRMFAGAGRLHPQAQ